MPPNSQSYQRPTKIADVGVAEVMEDPPATRLSLLASPLVSLSVSGFREHLKKPKQKSPKARSCRWEFHEVSVDSSSNLGTS